MPNPVETRHQGWTGPVQHHRERIAQTLHRRRRIHRAEDAPQGGEKGQNDKKGCVRRVHGLFSYVLSVLGKHLNNTQIKKHLTAIPDFGAQSTFY